MEASHKTHQPHIKVGKDEEKKKFHICKRFVARIIHHAQQTTAQTRCITSNMLTPLQCDGDHKCCFDIMT